MKFFLPILLTAITFPVLANPVETALSNGKQAQEALARSNRVLHAYLKRLDPVTGLLPRRGGQNTWYVRDSAADLYPFLVMAAYFTDRNIYANEMLSIFRSEILHSTRLGRLSDNVLPGGQGFEFKEPDYERIVFGSAEYAKDGLLPLTELLGRSVWCERLIGIAEEIIQQASYETRFGRIPSLDAEVNGDLLQVFSRLSYMTHDPRYTDQAIRIADFYFNEVIPGSNGLPCHQWDFGAGKPSIDRFSFADHGNEIVGGLSELVLFLKESNHPRYADFKQPLADLMDTLLLCGLNSDGVWYGSIEPSSRRVLDHKHAHCWGYLFNSVYTAYLITGEERYLGAVKRAIQAVKDNPSYLDDPAGSGRNYGSNAYADSIESAMIFLNRLPESCLSEVLDECVPRFLSRQREDGLIEDWYGDGNYVRTALMYALMKSQGTWVEPWSKDLCLGAVAKDAGALIVLEADASWEGRLRFDVPRHRKHLNLTVNYPRLNEFPEWFTATEDRLYSVRQDGSERILAGGELVQGINLRMESGKMIVLEVMPLPGPPYQEPYRK